MGNAATPQLMEWLASGQTEPREPNKYSGMLAWVTPDIRMEAARQMPPPSADEKERVRHVEVVDPHMGRVRIRFELYSYKHYRNRFWRWGAVWADVIEAPPADTIAP